MCVRILPTSGVNGMRGCVGACVRVVQVWVPPHCRTPRSLSPVMTTMCRSVAGSPVPTGRRSQKSAPPTSAAGTAAQLPSCTSLKKEHTHTKSSGLESYSHFTYCVDAHAPASFVTTSLCAVEDGDSPCVSCTLLPTKMSCHPLPRKAFHDSSHEYFHCVCPLM